MEENVPVPRVFVDQAKECLTWAINSLELQLQSAQAKSLIKKLKRRIDEKRSLIKKLENLVEIKNEKADVAV